MIRFSIASRRGVASALIVASVALASSEALAANLLTNGSFEGPPANNFAAGYYRGPLAPDGWQRVSGLEAPDILSNSYVQNGAGFQTLIGAQEGVRFLDMNGASPTGGLFQTVSGLTAGGTVSLDFWVARWAQNSSGTLTASLFDASNQGALASQVVTLTHLPNAVSSSWTQYTVSAVVPVSGTIKVQFAGNSGSSARGAPGLDNVSLTFTPGAGAVPEPATWAMMIAGFGMAGAMLRRRTRSARA
jgi:hypothetical protein